MAVASGFIPGTLFRVEFDFHKAESSNTKDGGQRSNQHGVKLKWPGKIIEPAPDHVWGYCSEILGGRGS